MSDDVPSSPKNIATEHDRSNPSKRTIIQLFKNLLGARLGNNPSLERFGSPTEWVDLIFSESNVFYGYDELMWGLFIACVYHIPQDAQLNCVLIDKVGASHFSSVDITQDSQYYSAIQNLAPARKDDQNRKCIAVTFLQRFAQLSEKDVRRVHPETFKFDYDPTHAGDLASACNQIQGEDTLVKIGKQLISSGIFENRLVTSTLLDVVYEYNETVSEPNNKLVFHLGQQLEQLFNPLTEYSPEQTEYTYKPPVDQLPTEEDNALVKAISRELLELQTNFTLNLVEFLQKFVITLRIEVLNSEIEGLSTVKLNRLFPPTIDEVTRINCIFLDSLKSATSFGSLEVLKACSITIPYFYKAYTRHEAATKHFNKDIKLFLKNFGDKIPLSDVFTEMKIDSLIKGPQEKLMKIKLIIDRLYSSKTWDSENTEEARKCYENIIEVIDSFGRLEAPLSSYSSRVFTPSGKILTELAKGWPTELQYKWLKRRVVGVFDMLDPNDLTKEKLLVIFSDYLIFLDVTEDRNTYESAYLNKPSISDILMNSLVNEVPLPPKMPQLVVSNYCYIEEVMVTLFGENSLRFDAFKGINSFAITLKIQNKSVSAHTVANLVTKAKILEKATAFHLFKAIHNDITMYSTAHEIEAYNSETIKSKFALFLNMPPNKKVIMQHKLHVAMFAKFSPINSDDELVELHILTSDGGLHSVKTSSKELVPTILKQLAFEIPVCFSSIYSPLLPGLLAANETIVKTVVNNHTLSNHLPKKVASRSSGRVRRNSQVKSFQNEASKFLPKHHPAKSYATITTFRSDVSDTKAVEGRNLEDKFDFEEAENPSKIRVEPEEPLKKEEAKNSFKDQTAQPPSRQELKRLPDMTGRHQKRRSITNVFRTIFGNKKKMNGGSTGVFKDKTKKKTNDAKRKTGQKRFSSAENENESKGTNQTKRSSALQNSNLKQKTSEHFLHNEKNPTGDLATNELSSSTNKALEKTRHLSLPLVPNGSSEDTSKNSNRLSATSDFIRPARDFSDGNNRDSVIFRNSQHQENASEDVGQPFEIGPPELNAFRKVSASALRKSDDNSESSSRRKTDTASEQNINNPGEGEHIITSRNEHLDETHSKGMEEDKVVEGLERKASRESQVFNDDLFGDVIPEPKKNSSFSNINEINTHIPQIEDSETIKKSPAFPRQKTSGTIGTNKAEDRASGIKSRENEPQSERIPNPKKDGIGQLRGNSQGKVSSKKSVDSKTQNLQGPKINFGNSSSVVELFQGMRLVLDESDAKYNWKRLPSEYSLRDTSPVNITEDRPASEPQHAFKAIAFVGGKVPTNAQTGSAVRSTPQVRIRNSEKTASDTEGSESAFNEDQFSSQERGRKLGRNLEEKSGNQGRLEVVHENGSGANNQDLSNEHDALNNEYIERNQLGLTVENNVFVSRNKPTLSVENGDRVHEVQKNKRGIDDRSFQNSQNDNRGLKSLSHPRINDETSQKKSSKSKIPTFKVVDHSPTRIIQKSSPDRGGSPYNNPSDISISPDLNRRANKRLFELRFPSREDVSDSNNSPIKNVVESSIPEITTQDMAYSSEISTPSVRHNEDSNTTPEESLSTGKVLPKDDGGLLEDLEFSSFNLTFENFNREYDASMMSTTHGPSSKMKDQERLSPTIENPTLEEPVIYHLAQSNESNSEGTHSNRLFNKRQTQIDDDPIWISPSKLDHYDIDKVTQPTFRDTEKMIRTATNKSMHKMLVENPTSMDELSFAYLASMIDEEDDQPPNANDRPIRLKFKE